MRRNVSESELQIMWNRLLSVVEEQAQTLVRTAFSTSVREAGDISAGVFDLEGRMLAQAVTGTPGHVNSMARSVIHFIREFPVDTMKPGDAYVTNDPWKGTGHLYDIVVHLARLPQRQAGGAVLLHHPRGRHRRAGAFPRRTPGLPRRPVPATAGADARRPDRREHHAHHPLQRARADPGRGRHPCA